MAQTAGGTYYAASSELVSSWPATSLDLANQLESRFAAKSTTADFPNSAWTTWTPTWTNLTVGNATQDFRYKQYGKLVVVRGQITLGSTSSMGNSPNFTLPVNMNTTGLSANISEVGICVHRISGVTYHGRLYYNSGSTLGVYANLVNGNYSSDAAVTATVPATWGNGSILIIHGFYEAA